MDFTNNTYTVTVPASTGSFTIPQLFEVRADNVDEIEQSFALIAELDVPEDLACFQTHEGSSDCFGTRGAIAIIIVDNDCKSLLYSLAQNVQFLARTL